MGKKLQYVARKLFAIRNNHCHYFADNNWQILLCVKINWEKPFSAHLVNTLLPFNIACDIEEMFWVS
jgi:hypothetical protein